MLVFVEVLGKRLRAPHELSEKQQIYSNARDSLFTMCPREFRIGPLLVLICKQQDVLCDRPAIASGIWSVDRGVGAGLQKRYVPRGEWIN